MCVCIRSSPLSLFFSRIHTDTGNAESPTHRTHDHGKCRTVFAVFRRREFVALREEILDATLTQGDFKRDVKKNEKNSTIYIGFASATTTTTTTRLLLHLILLRVLFTSSDDPVLSRFSPFQFYRKTLDSSPSLPSLCIRTRRLRLSLTTFASHLQQLLDPYRARQ